MATVRHVTSSSGTRKISGRWIFVRLSVYKSYVPLLQPEGPPPFPNELNTGYCRESVESCSDLHGILILEFSLLYIRLDTPRMFLKCYPPNRHSASNAACSCHTSAFTCPVRIIPLLHSIWQSLPVTKLILHYYWPYGKSVKRSHPWTHYYQPDLTTFLQPRHIPTQGYNITQSSAPDDGHMVALNMLSNY